MDSPDIKGYDISAQPSGSSVPDNTLNFTESGINMTKTSSLPTSSFANSTAVFKNADQNFDLTNKEIQNYKPVLLNSFNNKTITRVGRSGSLLRRQENMLQPQNSTTSVYHERLDDINSRGSGNNNGNTSFVFPSTNKTTDKSRFNTISRMTSQQNFKDTFSSSRNSRVSDEHTINTLHHHPNSTAAINIKTPQGHRKNKSIDSNDDSHSLYSVSSSLTASFSKNFLSGFYKNKIKRRRKGQIVLLSEKYWMKDDNCKECFYCAKSFYTFRRKHHCRLCGQIFCSSCAILVPGEKFGYDHKLRFCKICLEHLENDLDSSDDDYSFANETMDNEQDDHNRDETLTDFSDGASNNLNNSMINYENVTYDHEIKTTADMASIFGEDNSKFLTESFNPPRLAIPARKTGESLSIEGRSNIRPRSYSQHYLTPTKEQGSIFPNNVSNTAANMSLSNSGAKLSINTPSARYRNRANEKNLYHNSKHNLVQSQIFPENKHYQDEAKIHNNVSDNVYSNNYSKLSKVKSDMSLGKFSSFFVSSADSNALNNNKSQMALKRTVSPPPIGEVNPKSNFTNSYSKLHSNIGNFSTLGLSHNRFHKNPSKQMIKSESMGNLKKAENQSVSNRNSYIDESDIATNNSYYDPDREEYMDDEDDEKENEASMSIFAALNSSNENQKKNISFDFTNNGTIPSDNNNNTKLFDSSIFRNRLDPDSSKRAEASLKRMKSRRKSKQRPTATTSSTTGGYLSSKAVTQRNTPSKDLNLDYSNGSSSTILVSESLDRNLNNAIPSSFDDHVFSVSETLIYQLRLLIKQTLEDQGVVYNLDIWGKIFEELVVPLDRIKVHTKLSDSLDYRQYIKIKRIAGGHITDSKFINGLIFSKNIPVRTMSSDIVAPKILLLMFPISYEKAKDRILSLDVLLAQEKEYLNSLVLRIMALEPDLVFVSDKVSGEALQLLEKAGITCQFNIKPQVIEKISKFTEADVVNSVDKLMINVNLGTCERFCVKTFRFGNVLKSYTMLTGCNPDNGGTILLRGLDDDSLRKIKNAAEFIAYAILSLRFESCFLKDSLIKINLADYKNLIETKENAVFEGIGSKFLETFSKRLMTISPGVTFSVPFLLERCRYLETKIMNVSKIKQDINLYSDEEFNDYCKNKKFLLEIKEKGNLSNIDLRYYTQLILEKQLFILQEKLSNKLRQWNIFYSLSDNILGIGFHQSISVMYSMISYHTGTPCIGPLIINIEYYWDNDVTLGQFIENIINTIDYPCSGACGGSLIDHYRTYVNGSAKVDVIVERLTSKVPALKNIILMWSYCKKCKITTPVLRMDFDSWNYSFGKYMELIFCGNKVLSGTVNGCNHDVFKDQIKYFGYNDVVIRLEWSPIDVHLLVTPSQQITWKPHKAILIKLELLSYINEQVESLYDSILKRLRRVKLDSSIEELNLEGMAKSLEIQKSSLKEKEIFLKYANEVYMNTAGTDSLSLNAVVAKLYSKSLTWMTTISEFEKKYLPSEKDIARITANQLKKLFMESKPEHYGVTKDKLLPHSKEISNEPSGSINHDANSEKDNMSLNSMNNGESSNTKDDEVDANNVNVQDAGPFDKKVEKAISAFDTVDKGNEIKNQNTNNLLSSHLRKMSHSEKETNVGKLASHFDNIYFDNLSKQFEYQRELEKRNMRKKYQSFSKPTKLQDSKPKVEVFQNVMDAVEEKIPTDDFVFDKETQSAEENKHHSSQTYNTENNALSSNKETVEDNIPVQHIDPEISGNEVDEETDNFDEEINSDMLAKHLDENNVVLSKITDSDSFKREEENMSLLQLLKTFWADRSTALWEPLHSPILPTEHIFDNNLIIIREDEPSSIIAFCLNSNEYVKKMEQAYVDYAAQINLNQDSLALINQDGETERLQSEALKENLLLIEAVMNKPTPIHLRYQVEDENVLMSCKIFFADQFDALRKASGCGLENTTDFIQSLSRCVKWDSSGGKSGSVFLKTLDDRFVLKELSHSEVDSFVQFAPNYFKYMSEAIYQKLPTVIAKIVGFFQIQFKNTDTGKSVKLDCIITENLFYGKKNVRIFDLKGSMRNRHVEQTGKENEVLLDENMVEYIYESPIFVREYDKKLLRASVWNDTLFLSKMNVMDYSLVIGIDNSNNKLFVGIIDCIRTFTWDKKLESWVKEKGFVGGSTKEPTVVTPKQYKNRFREAMERYILMVPDPWSGQGGKQDQN